MNVRIITACVLVVFVSYTAYTMATSNQSLLSFGHQLLASPDTAQVLIDLYIMAMLAVIWMYIDCKKLRKPVWYWLIFALITCVFVSVGPLLYLVLRTDKLVANEPQ